MSNESRKTDHRYYNILLAGEDLEINVVSGCTFLVLSLAFSQIRKTKECARLFGLGLQKFQLRFCLCRDRDVFSKKLKWIESAHIFRETHGIFSKKHTFETV